MANLIITIIAIALVAVAALMGAYYGGSAFNKGQEKAMASSIMNQGAQIQAAYQMFKADGGTVSTATIGTLTETTTGVGGPYLSIIPSLKGEAWTMTSSVATLTAANDLAISGEVCVELEKQVGDDDDPWLCTDDTSVTFTLN